MSDAVYEPAYEPYEGQRTTRLQRLLAIASRGWVHMRSSTWFWVLLGVSLVHVAVRGVVLYVTGQVDLPPGSVPAQAQDQIQFTARFLSDTLATQARWVLTFMLVAVGVDAISEDLDAGGLTFYFTKPLTKPGYVAGKLAAPFTAALLVTALPVLLLWVLGVAFTPSELYPSNVWLLPVALLGASIVASLFATLVVAGLSGLLSDGGRAAVVWIALVLVLAGAAQVADAVTGDPASLLVDPYNAVEKVTHLLTGVDASAAPGLGSVLTVAGWMAAGLGALTWTLHREEVAG